MFYKHLFPEENKNKVFKALRLTNNIEIIYGILLLFLKKDAWLVRFIRIYCEPELFLSDVYSEPIESFRRP